MVRTPKGRESDEFPPAPFEGFSQSTLGFFLDLAANQEVSAAQAKAWVADNKAVYEQQVKAPLASLIATLTNRFAEEGLALRGDAARSTFRLNRDIRFSKNKDPYKTHVGAVLTRDGGKQTPGVLYFHLDPMGSFVAAGFYQPEPDVLQRMRAHLIANPAAWTDLEAVLTKAGLPLDKSDTLVRFPKGFEAPPPAVADAVKLKTWIVRRDLTQKQIHATDLVERVVAFALSAAPLLEFGWSAVDRR